MLQWSLYCLLSSLFVSYILPVKILENWSWYLTYSDDKNSVAYFLDHSIMQLNVSVARIMLDSFAIAVNRTDNVSHRNWWNLIVLQSTSSRPIGCACYHGWLQQQQQQQLCCLYSLCMMCNHHHRIITTWHRLNDQLRSYLCACANRENSSMPKIGHNSIKKSAEWSAW